MRFTQLASRAARLPDISPIGAPGSRASVLREAVLVLLIGLGIGLSACARSIPSTTVEPRLERPSGRTVVAVDGGPVHTEPAVLKSVAPEYPKLAQHTGSSGEVLLRVRIDQEGAVRWILLEKSNRRFDGAAVQAVREWQFTPALRDGEPIPVDVLIPMRFRADG